MSPQWPNHPVKAAAFGLAVGVVVVYLLVALGVM